MNYPESTILLERIKKANKILLTCHTRPDPDSITSSLSLAYVLEKMGKVVDIICADEILNYIKFLPGVDKIKKVDYENFDFSQYDLLIVPDTANWSRVVGHTNAKTRLPILVIDNHETNTRFGEINLIDTDTSSVAELLYFIYLDWKVEIDKTLATYLLTGILGDTGAFQFEVKTKTFSVVDVLLKKGPNYDDIILNLFNTRDPKLLVTWGVILQKLKLDTEHQFCWSAVSYDDFVKSGSAQGARESAASVLLKMVEGTKFGFIAIEESPKVCNVSFRTRTDFDVSRLASELGGGGHPTAAGVEIYDKDFTQAVEVILSKAREFSEK